jgi:hypothetical protein
MILKHNKHKSSLVISKLIMSKVCGFRSSFLFKVKRIMSVHVRIMFVHFLFRSSLCSRILTMLS